VSTDHESQTGEVLENVIYRELKRFKIHSKLFAMASDNGSNMVAAWPILVDLCAKDGAIIDEDMHARCVCHVINIVVRAFLKDIGANLSLSSVQLADQDSGAWHFFVETRLFWTRTIRQPGQVSYILCALQS
jgi:hypothetical protein